MTDTISIAEINVMDRAAFGSALGSIYEHSSWVAERVWEARPFKNRAALGDAMEQTVRAAGCSAQLELLRLGAKGKLTELSHREQAGAGLRSEEISHSGALQELNDDYEKKFGFPFIIAVRGLSPETIVARCRARLNADKQDEFAESLRQVFKIASFRLAELVTER
jgi:2-oxo-4-hydroxy-4-carboxy-5-ureidoimidazoline decarboxylase